MIQPFAAGRDADVYALDASRVLRRYRNGGDVSVEAAVMAYVERHAYPVPKVYEAAGTDLVMERLDGATMQAALLDGTVTFEAAAGTLADLHRLLHEVPARASRTPQNRVLHMDLHPANVMLTTRGPVVIDWRNTIEGPADLDVAMSAVILAQVAVDDSELSAPATAFLAAFLRAVDGDPVRQLDRAVAIRRADPALSPEEVARLPVASTMVRAWVR